MLVIPPDVQCECRRQTGVIGELRHHIIIVAVTHSHFRSLIFEWRPGMNIDHSANGVAPVERALRTSEHLDGRHVEHVAVERRGLKMGHAIHVKAHRRAFHLRHYAANGDGCGLPGAIVGDEKVGHEARNVGNVGHLSCLDLCPPDGRYRYGREVVPVGFVPGDDHFIQFVLRVDAVSVECRCHLRRGHEYQSREQLYG